MPNTEKPTRYYSDLQERRVAKNLGGEQVSNSGAGKWYKGDVVVANASLLVECKTVTRERDSITLKKEWLVKNGREAKEMRLYHECVAVNFGPDELNYYIIDENLMQYLVGKLIEDSGD